MSFFVVERNSLDSSLSVPLPEEFPTREAAIAALSAATAAGSVSLTGEVFIADLSAAVPVLVMQTPTPVPSIPETDDGVVEDSDGDVAEADAIAAEPETGVAEVENVAEAVGELDAPAADAAYASWEPLGEVQDEEASLAEALKRATTSLEDEGIVAPSSIESAPIANAADDLEALIDAVAEEEADQPAAASEVTEPASVTLADAEKSATSEWPWANIESYEVSEASTGVPTDVDAESDVADAALAADEDAESREPEGEGEEAAEPAIEAAVVESDAAPDEEGDLAEVLADLTGSFDEPAVEDGPIITGAPSEGEDAYVPRPVILGDYADAGGGVPADVSVAADFGVQPGAAEEGYAPDGELDLGEYTCQDCIYSNTCPKVGEASPADCGSFQWKSD
jgi:hypothetical protein